jgi:hypothetical protein
MQCSRCQHGESPEQCFGECGGRLASALCTERSDAMAYQAAETIPSEGS